MFAMFTESPCSTCFDFFVCVYLLCNKFTTEASKSTTVQLRGGASKLIDRRSYRVKAPIRRQGPGATIMLECLNIFLEIF